MPDRGGEISIHLQVGLGDPNEERWLILPLSVGEDVILEMLPNPTTPRSTIRPRVMRELQVRGLVPQGGPASVVLRDLRITGQPVPELEVHVGQAARLLGVDGMLGLDFFAKFRRVIFDPATLNLSLISF